MVKQILIAVEGIDGAGKSSLSRMLSGYLCLLGVKNAITSEPTSGPYGSLIKNARERLPASLERDLFTQDRKEHYNGFIKKSLSEGHVVITDRYIHSSLAYQGTRPDHGLGGGYTRQMVVQEIKEANFLEGIKMPDVLIVLDRPVDDALKIIETRGRKLSPFENREVLSLARKQFLSMAGNHDRSTVIFMDDNFQRASVEAIEFINSILFDVVREPMFSEPKEVSKAQEFLKKGLAEIADRISREQIEW